MFNDKGLEKNLLQDGIFIALLFGPITIGVVLIAVMAVCEGYRFDFSPKGFQFLYDTFNPILIGAGLSIPFSGLYAAIFRSRQTQLQIKSQLNQNIFINHFKHIEELEKYIEKEEIKDSFFKSRRHLHELVYPYTLSSEKTFDVNVELIEASLMFERLFFYEKKDNILFILAYAILLKKIYRDVCKFDLTLDSYYVLNSISLIHKATDFSAINNEKVFESAHPYPDLSQNTLGYLDKILIECRKNLDLGAFYDNQNVSIPNVINGEKEKECDYFLTIIALSCIMIFGKDVFFDSEKTKYVPYHIKVLGEGKIKDVIKEIDRIVNSDMSFFSVQDIDENSPIYYLIELKDIAEKIVKEKSFR